MDIQQMIFTQLRLDIEAKGYDVYDGELPPEGTACPFVYLGDSSQSDKTTKAGYIGDALQTIHVWHDAKKRGTVSAMLADIKDICRQIADRYSLVLTGMTQNILEDSTTKQLHGILTVKFKF